MFRAFYGLVYPIIYFFNPAQGRVNKGEWIFLTMGLLVKGDELLPEVYNQTSAAFLVQGFMNWLEG